MFVKSTAFDAIQPCILEWPHSIENDQDQTIEAKGSRRRHRRRRPRLNWPLCPKAGQTVYRPVSKTVCRIEDKKV